MTESKYEHIFRRHLLDGLTFREAADEAGLTEKQRRSAASMLPKARRRILSTTEFLDDLATRRIRKLAARLDSGELSDRKELDTVRLVRAYQALQDEPATPSVRYKKPEAAPVPGKNGFRPDQIRL